MSLKLAHSMECYAHLITETGVTRQLHIRTTHRYPLSQNLQSIAMIAYLSCHYPSARAGSKELEIRQMHLR